MSYSLRHNTVQIKRPPSRNRKKGGKEDQEAVQMAYYCHHQNRERKDMPHDRNDSENGVGKTRSASRWTWDCCKKSSQPA